MGVVFDGLSTVEQGAVSQFVREEYDRVVFQQPTTDAVRQAQADPNACQEALREVIAGDSRRIRAILDSTLREPAAQTASPS